jgi:predicted nucleic acid-binding protein
MPVSRDTLLDAASLRARFGLRTPDAILLATGLRAGATAALTNDESWTKIPLLTVVALSKVAK